jgi:hypothetical protein
MITGMPPPLVQRNVIHCEIAGRTAALRRRLLTEHHLQAFSPRALREESRPPDYDGDGNVAVVWWQEELPYVTEALRRQTAGGVPVMR